MTNFKLTISDKKGKSLTKELKDNEGSRLLGLRIGSEADASVVGLTGKLHITGGSDKSGVPMRTDLHGSSRKYVLLSKGVGLNNVEKGERIRKLTRGNTISEEIYQINCKFDGEIPVEQKTESTPEDDASSQKEEKKKEKSDSPKKTENQEKKE